MNKSEAYLGNLNLKRRNVSIEYTQEQINEYLKCANDPIYFIESYVKIISVDKGLISFSLYDYQKEMVDLATKERYVICKMPRQCGKTTTIVGTMLWYVLFHENYNVAILANKLSQAREILSRIQLAYEHLPRWLQQGIIEWNKGNVELENGSKILASSTSSSAIRGGSFNMIYLDEFAFVPNNMQEQFFSSVYPTISSGQTSKVLITSTPNGLNLFYKLWKDSEEERNNYKRINIHWSDVPGRDEKWREETIKNTSEDQFRVEFECEFVGSTSTLIHPVVLRRLTYETPIKSNEHIKVYEEPSKQGVYIVVADTSRGVNGDYSAFVVFDVTTIPYKVSAVYRNNEISTLLYPNIIYQFAQHYNNAYILVESNDVGKQVADIIYSDLEYEQVFWCSQDPKSGQYISGGYRGSAQVGVRTTKSVKRIGCSNFKSMVENDKIIINDYNLLNELFRFVAKGESYEAEEGNDDLVMCCVLFSWAMQQTYVKDLTSSDIRQNLYNQSEQLIESELLPFGVFSDGREMLEENQPLLAVPSNNDAWLH